MWELDYIEGWAPKNWCFKLWCWRRLFFFFFEKTLESPLNNKEIKPANPKENQPWRFIHWKDSCCSSSSNTLATWCKEQTHWQRPWCWERLKAKGEGVAEDEMVRWHHQINGHEFEQTPGESGGQRSVVWYSPWDQSQTQLRDWKTKPAKLIHCPIHNCIST